MAAIADTVFTDHEIRTLVEHARERAQHYLGRNRQESYASYEKLATALQQLADEKEGVIRARSETAEEGSDEGESKRTATRKR